MQKISLLLVGLAILSSVLGLTGCATVAPQMVMPRSGQEVLLSGAMEYPAFYENKVAFCMKVPGSWGSWYGAQYELFVMDKDGSNLQRLTYDTGIINEKFPKWTSDGRIVYFSTDEFLSWEYYIINSDGTGKQRISRKYYDSIK